jgi:hypothetical protein
MTLSGINLPFFLCDRMIFPRSPPPQYCSQTHSVNHGLAKDHRQQTHLHHNVDFLLILVDNLVMQHHDIGVTETIQNVPIPEQ